MLFEDEDGDLFALLAAGRGGDNGTLGTFEENRGDDESGFGLIDVDSEEHWQGDGEGFALESENLAGDEIDTAISGEAAEFDGPLELVGVGHWSNNFEMGGDNG